MRKRKSPHFTIVAKRIREHFGKQPSAEARTFQSTEQIELSEHTINNSCHLDPNGSEYLKKYDARKQTKKKAYKMYVTK